MLTQTIFPTLESPILQTERREQLEKKLQTWSLRTTKETYPESKRASAKPGTKEGVFQRVKRWFCSGHTRSEPWSFGASYWSICVMKRKPCPCSLLLPSNNQIILVVIWRRFFFLLWFVRFKTNNFTSTKMRFFPFSLPIFFFLKI